VGEYLASGGRRQATLQVSESGRVRLSSAAIDAMGLGRGARYRIDLLPSEDAVAVTVGKGQSVARSLDSFGPLAAALRDMGRFRPGVYPIERSRRPEYGWIVRLGVEE
jgi:hypothetical protein